MSRVRIPSPAPSWNIPTVTSVIIHGASDAFVPAMVSAADSVLAFGLGRPDPLSNRMADPATLPHRGSGRGRGPGVDLGAVYIAGAAGAKNRLTSRLKGS